MTDKGWKTLLIICAALILPGGCSVIPPSAAEIENPNLRFARTYAASPTIVYRKLLEVAERNDRKIIQEDEAALTLKIHWSFNVFLNRWGGKALIKCDPNGNRTTVLIGGFSEQEIGRAHV
jgi:hypothetical protein